jgi:hypothetical protein
MFCSFPHDAHGVLTAIHRFAPVSEEHCFDPNK